MVCVNQAFLLDGLIIQGRKKNVNGPEATFTICLQEWKIYGFSFTNRSKYIVILHIDGHALIWYYLAC